MNAAEIVPLSPLSRSRIENIRAVPVSDKDHPMPAPILSSINWDNRIGFNQAPMAEWPFLVGYTQFPKGTMQLVVAGVRLPVRRQKDPFLKKPLGLQIRLTSYHRHAGDPATGFILLSHAFHLEICILWRHPRVGAQNRPNQQEFGKRLQAKRQSLSRKFLSQSFFRVASKGAILEHGNVAEGSLRSSMNGSWAQHGDSLIPNRVYALGNLLISSVFPARCRTKTFGAVTDGGL